MKLRVLPAALADLRSIRAYIARDSPAAADAVAARLDAAIQLLAGRPEIGRPTKSKSIREWSVPGVPYVVPYRMDGDTVEILRVFHTSRKRPEAW